MENFEGKFEMLSCPVVVTDDKGQVLYRNRLAQRLLPPPGRLKRFLQSLKEKKTEFIFEAALDDIRYFVAVFPEGENCFRLCFLEHFLPFYEPFSRMVLEEMQDFFWQLFAEKGREETEVALSGFLDALAARTYRLRSEEKAYLRLLQMRSYVPGERVSCSVSGFFHHLQTALSTRGIRLFVDCPPDLSAQFSTAAFTLLALNLVQFAYLFEGGDEIRVKVSPKGKEILFDFSFDDPMDFSSVCQGLLDTNGTDRIPGALMSSPLFCALCLCRKEEISWRFHKEKSRLCFAFSLPEATTLPAAFLAESTAQEVKELINLEKEWFSR